MTAARFVGEVAALEAPVGFKLIDADGLPLA
jgi:hypothetical protein